MSAAQIDSVLRLKLAEQMLGKQVVEVVAAQVIVAMAGKHLGYVALQRDDGDIEGAAAQVVDHGGVTAAFSIRQACGRRLVQDAHRLQARPELRPRAWPALRVGEIGGNGDDRFSTGPAELAAGPGGKLAQDQRRDLLRRELAVSQRNGLVAAHLALDAAHRALGIEHQLIARRLAHQQLSGRGKPTTEGSIFLLPEPRIVTLPSTNAAISEFVVPRSMPTIKSLISQIRISCSIFPAAPP
jgi:hypothetical protein